MDPTTVHSSVDNHLTFGARKEQQQRQRTVNRVSSIGDNQRTTNLPSVSQNRHTLMAGLDQPDAVVEAKSLKPKRNINMSHSFHAPP